MIAYSKYTRHQVAPHLSDKGPLDMALYSIHLSKQLKISPSWTYRFSKSSNP